MAKMLKKLQQKVSIAPHIRKASADAEAFSVRCRLIPQKNSLLRTAPEIFQASIPHIS